MAFIETFQKILDCKFTKLNGIDEKLVFLIPFPSILSKIQILYSFLYQITAKKYHLAIQRSCDHRSFLQNIETSFIFC